MKIVITLAAIAMLTSYQPMTPAPVHQVQMQHFFSAEEKFLNSVMVRAYNNGDTASLKELLQFWQDEHSTAL
jgi:hypothetical protein